MNIDIIFLSFGIGFFSICAQSLIFREFLSAFDSNQIAVSLFFFTWLFWVGFAGILISKSLKIRSLLAKFAVIVFYLYIPSLILQFLLFAFFRDLFGIKQYELLSIVELLIYSLILNAPASIFTALSFQSILIKMPINKRENLPIFYGIEALGAFMGGLFSVLMFRFAFSSFSLLVYSSIIFFIISSFSLRKKYAVSFVGFSLLIGILCMLFKLDAKIADSIFKRKWSRILSIEFYRGSFSTNHSQYSYGIFYEQLYFIRDHGIYEILPDYESAIPLLTAAYSQREKYEKIIVAGANSNIAIAFNKNSKVIFFPNDIQYTKRAFSELSNLAGFEIKNIPEVAKFDILNFADKNPSFVADLALIEMGDLASVSAERFCSVEFIGSLKKLITPNAIVIFSFDSAENYLSDELALSGAIIYQTITKSFSNIAIFAGEKSYILASDSNIETSQELMIACLERAVQRGVELPPPLIKVIASVERSASVLQRFLQFAKSQPIINKGKNNLLSFLPLARIMRKNSMNISPALKLFNLREYLFSIPLLMCFILSFFFLGKMKIENRYRRKILIFLVFSSGFIGLSAVLILINLFQISHGTIFVFFGFLTSLFMLGASLGACLSSIRFFELLLVRNAVILGFCANLICLIILYFLPNESLSVLIFALLFFIFGGSSGFIFNCVWRLDESEQSAIKYISADYLGSALATMVGGILLLSFCGINSTLLFLCIFVFISLAIFAISLSETKGYLFLIGDVRSIRYAVYFILLSISLSTVILFNMLNLNKEKEYDNHIPNNILKELAGDFDYKKINFNEKSEFSYYAVFDKNAERIGWIFNSSDFSPPIKGFSGNFEIAIFANNKGELISFKIIKHGDTEEYVDEVLEQYRKLKQIPITKSEFSKNIDLVSGATFSSNAIAQTICISGENFFRHISGKEFNDSVSQIRLDWKSILYIIFFAFAAIFVSLKGNKIWRLTILTLSFFVGGFLLNLQFSSQDVLNTLVYPWNFSFLGAAVLIITLIVGNIYCGYICPFGATQELIHVMKSKLLRNASLYKFYKPIVFLTSLKYFLLAYIFFEYIFDLNYKITDPLKIFFARHSWKNGIEIAFLFLFASLFYPRLWCRIFCPTGSFLSLLLFLSLLRHKLPTKIYKYCPFGVKSPKQIDCLSCDLCREKFRETK